MSGRHAGPPGGFCGCAIAPVPYNTLMFAHERHGEILKLLRKRRRLDVRELEERLGVSSATLRRDLGRLDRANQVLRVHGGVVLPGSVPGEADLRQKSATAIQAKRRIAARVAADMPANATVFIDGGTTCLEAGMLLCQREDLTVITNSLPLIARYERFAARLIVLGGEHRTVSGALVGALALDALAHLRADIALIGTSGMDPDDGATTTEAMESAVKREWIRRAKFSWLLADATKWQERAASHFAGWAEFACLFTDRRPPEPIPCSSLKILLP